MTEIARSDTTDAASSDGATPWCGAIPAINVAMILFTAWLGNIYGRFHGLLARLHRHADVPKDLRIDCAATLSDVNHAVMVMAVVSVVFAIVLFRAGIWHRIVSLVILIVAILVAASVFTIA